MVNNSTGSDADTKNGENTTTTVKRSATTAKAIGKRKDPPPSSSSTSMQTSVDKAFQRLFGYTWGTTFDTTSTNNEGSSRTMVSELTTIFGSKTTAVRIMNLPSIVVDDEERLPKQEKDPATMLTTRIIQASKKNGNSVKRKISCFNAISHPPSQFKRMRLSEDEYKNIELPKDVIIITKQANNADNASSNHRTTPAAATKPSATIAAKSSTGNIDTVLEQIAGRKKLNTVEKTSNDWESFKGSDKQLQDDLERVAQSKNAYLVKQDFLDRVDQRTFELEKEERDKERARRAVATTKK